jgi:deoxyribodipyrimidine photo-lyase
LSQRKIYFMDEIDLVWMRNDLRITDNPALHAACARGGDVRALYIHETDLRRRGAASRWWLHESLKAVARRLAELGIRLEVRAGESGMIVPALALEIGARSVVWNRRYAPAARELDARIKAQLAAAGIWAKSFAGNVLIEPFEIATKSGTPYSVYTPFWNALRLVHIATPIPAPAGLKPVAAEAVDGAYAAAAWTQKLAAHWSVGEDAAAARLKEFLDELVQDYPADRDNPRKAATSRLSPHLAFGEISARQVWHAALAVSHAAPEKAEATGKFLSELAWRDFNIHQLYHRPDITTVPMNAKYDRFPWRDDEAGLDAWRRGMTGIPMVDAGMRELWATGAMHNRVRMLTASFLTKNLLVDWRRGEQWFWDTLVDADEANNPGNWQWVAGSGMDASPYFRIFNPVTQGEKFDPTGEYVRRWVPEVRGLPDKQVHQPWVVGGVAGYPAPIVDLKHSRERALAGFRSL